MRWIILIPLGLLAMGCFAMALTFGLKGVDLQAHAERIPGVITGHLEHTCSSTDRNNRRVSYRCYQSLVRYEVRGVTRESPVDGERSAHADEPGTEVKLLVDTRTEPFQVHVDDFGIWIAPLLGMVFGLLCSGFAVFVFRLKL